MQRCSARYYYPPCRLLLDLAGAPLGPGLLGLVAALRLRGQALLAPASKEGKPRRLLGLLLGILLILLIPLQCQYLLKYPHRHETEVTVNASLLIKDTMVGTQAGLPGPGQRAKAIGLAVMPSPHQATPRMHRHVSHHCKLSIRRRSGRPHRMYLLFEVLCAIALKHKELGLAVGVRLGQEAHDARGLVQVEHLEAALHRLRLAVRAHVAAHLHAGRLQGYLRKHLPVYMLIRWAWVLEELIRICQQVAYDWRIRVPGLVPALSAFILVEVQVCAGWIYTGRWRKFSASKAVLRSVMGMYERVLLTT